MTDFDDDLLLHDDPDEGDESATPDVEIGAVDDAKQPTGDEAHPADSPMERMRAAAERQMSRTRLVMEFPGWEGELLVEFGLLSKRDAKQLRSATRSARDDTSKVVADLLVTASRGLRIYNDAGIPVPFRDGGRDVGFADVGQFVKLPVKTERQGLLALFIQEIDGTPQLNEISLQAFGDRIGRWMADTSLRPEGAVDLTVDGAGDVVEESINSGS